MGALQCSMAGVITGLPQPLTFESLLHQLDGIYGLTNARKDALLCIQSIRMDANEKGGVSVFAEKVHQLCMRAYPNYTEVDREEQTLCVFLQGLPTRGDFRMQMRMQNFTTLREAVEHRTRLEQFLKDERGVGKLPQLRGASEDLSGQVLSRVDKLSHEMARMRDDQAKQVEALRSEIGHQAGRGHGAPGQLAPNGPGVGAGQRTTPSTGPGVPPWGAGLGHGGGPGGEGPGQSRWRPGGRNPGNSPCLSCGLLGHWARFCPQRRNQPGNGPPNSL